MLGRGKACSRAASVSALAVSTDEQPTVEGDFTQSLYQNSNRFDSNTVLPVSGIDLREVEWIEPDSLDAEVSGLVTTLTTSHNPKRYCRTSTSSGYSSHSPPLSATSYSCCVSAIPQQNEVGVSAASPLKDQGSGLAVIHEGEAIPRPIWPCVGGDPRKIRHEGRVDYYTDVKCAHPCCCYGQAYSFPYYEWNCEQSSKSVTQEVLVELSRKLNSVLGGDSSISAEEILRDISRTIAQGIELNKKTLFEDYTYRNSSSLSGGKDSFSTEVNPINSRIYGKTENYLGLQNSPWSTSHCQCEKGCFGHDLLTVAFEEQTNFSLENDKKGKEDTPGVFMIPENQSFFTRNIHSYNKQRKISCCTGSGNLKEVPNFKENEARKESARLNNNRDMCDLKKEYSTLNHEYSMLNCGEEGSSSEGVSRASSKDSWCREAGIFEKSLDFTLDGLRAERLRQSIEESKRKRQWCRAITTLFGLVFFMLSVIIVSLSVTKGRKVFGSM